MDQPLCSVFLFSLPFFFPLFKERCASASASAAASPSSSSSVPVYVSSLCICIYHMCRGDDNVLFAYVLHRYWRGEAELCDAGIGSGAEPAAADGDEGELELEE